MRGSDERSGSLFSYVDLEARVRADAAHDPGDSEPGVERVVDGIQGALYTDFGRPSIAPEEVAFYGIRSERQLMERLEFDLLFR
jgi:hypothetical protein